ncbi:MAG: two-component sensor histidine kinase, partial [Lachnospiraceae bacterium]|nr:two-component sensor histidine kinase [Lachnospiraceae bacterium]
MKRKIHKMLVLIATLAIFLTMAFITVVFYDLFRKQVIEDLHAYAILLGAKDDMDSISEMAESLEENELRITIVGKDGQVIFDSEVNPVYMENHSQRPEIIEALQKGEGQAVRNSQTLSRNTFYYATRLENGSVLRVAKDAGSIYVIFARAVPSLLVTLLLLLVLCLLMAHFLTRKLIRPIERLAENLDEYSDKTDYEELTPFIQMIRQQHQDIIKNAKMRQEFTANVSHELKTPLTSISGYAELIETGMASEKDVVRFAHGIHNSANRLLTLINDIIRLSELDGTEEELVLESINLYEMAETCV